MWLSGLPTRGVFGYWREAAGWPLRCSRARSWRACGGSRRPAGRSCSGSSPCPRRTVRSSTGAEGRRTGSGSPLRCARSRGWGSCRTTWPRHRQAPVARPARDRREMTLARLRRHGQAANLSGLGSPLSEPSLSPREVRLEPARNPHACSRVRTYSPAGLAVPWSLVRAMDEIDTIPMAANAATTR